jgi:hypothetical protein
MSFRGTGSRKDRAANRSARVRRQAVADAGGPGSTTTIASHAAHGTSNNHSGVSGVSGVSGTRQQPPSSAGVVVPPAWARSLKAGGDATQAGDRSTGNNGVVEHPRPFPIPVTSPKPDRVSLRSLTALCPVPSVPVRPVTESRAQRERRRRKPMVAPSWHPSFAAPVWGPLAGVRPHGSAPDSMAGGMHHHVDCV